jgi:hypothetical protein
MSAESAVVSALTAGGVTALVSTRVYPDVRPQEDIMPAIVYQRSGTTFETTIHGTVAVTRAQMGVGCYAETRAGAEAVADAAHTALLAAGFIPQGRNGDFEDVTNHYIVALLYEHIST